MAYEPLGVVTAWIGLASFTTGRELLSRLGVEPDSTSAEFALSLGAGLGVLIVVLIPIGLAGLYGPVLFAALLSTPLILFRHRLVDLWNGLSRMHVAWADMAEARSALVAIAVVFVSVFELIFLLAALTPTITKDAISYHVPSAQHYVSTGRLEPVPGLDIPIRTRTLFSRGHSTAYSYYPQSYEEILTVALALGGWPAMQFTEPLFYLLALLILLAIGRSVGLTRFQRVIGLVGAISLPFASWSGSTIKNDLAMASFQLLALYWILEARKNKPAIWLILTAAFLGLSFGVKHIALFGGIPIGLLMLHDLWRREKRWKWLIVATLTFAASGLFWHARAYVLKGSPVYPANTRVAVTQFRAPDQSRLSRAAVYFVYPLMAHFDGRKVIELPIATPCGLFLAFLVVAWPLTRHKSPSTVTWTLVTYFGLYYIYWTWVWGVLRYGIAPIMVLAVLAGGRAAVLWTGGRSANRMLVSAGVTLGLLGALPPLLIIEINPPQIQYLTGNLDRDGYLEASNRFYPSIRELTRIMEPGQVAIGINNCARAYMENPTMMHCLELGRVDESDQADTEDLLRQSPPDYLVVSVRGVERMWSSVIEELRFEQVYSDAVFSIYAAPHDQL